MTGARGPLTGSKHGNKPGPKPDPERQKLLGNAPRPSRRQPSTSTAMMPSHLPVPPAPDHFGPVGLTIWTEIHRSMPILHRDLDRHTVTRYCDIAVDAIRARDAVELLGLLIEQPIVSPSGSVVGTKYVLNPAEAALRRADKALDSLADRLGLSPTARARLGVEISQTQLAQANADRVLAGLFQTASSPLLDLNGTDDED